MLTIRGGWEKRLPFTQEGNEDDGGEVETSRGHHRQPMQTNQTWPDSSQRGGRSNLQLLVGGAQNAHLGEATGQLERRQDSM